MSDIVHIYCDESCHLEHDLQSSMALGAISCPASTRDAIGRSIKELKATYKILGAREIKWTQISPSNVEFYLELVDLFFNDSRLRFRAVVIPDKNVLDHERYQQTHDTFYYKMWWLLLTRLIDDEHRFRIFLDQKDTQGRKKIKKLQEVLCNAHYDFDRERILDVQEIRSHDVVLVQLADLLVGALSHLHRGIQTSSAKQRVIEKIKQKSGLTLLRSTLPQATKFNVFVWQPRPPPAQGDA